MMPNTMPTIAEEKESQEQLKSSHQTIFYQGITCSQTHASHYSGEHEIPTTTGEVVLCKGRNNLKPIDVLINPFIGSEIRDVNTKPFYNLSSYFNPVKLATSSLSRIAHWYHGIEVRDQQDAVYQKPNSVKGHSINISEISIGQETDIESHYEKYEHWKEQYPNNKLIAYGVSRGAATTFNACAKYKYPELELVILEACFYSIHDVLHLNNYHPLESAFTTGLSLFTKYHDDGPSPGKNIEEFPENIPVVFITSEIDQIIPSKSTERLARELAGKQKNDVYLLTLKRSRHPNYPFDDAADRERYECFLHAIYLKYGLTNNSTFNLERAKKGESLLDECLLTISNAIRPGRQSILP